MREIRGILYVKEHDMRELMKDGKFIRMDWHMCIDHPDYQPQNKDAIGFYLTRYNRLEVIPINCCSTCRHYEPREGEGT